MRRLACSILALVLSTATAFSSQFNTPTLIYNSFLQGLGSSPFTISTGVPNALVLIDYYVAAEAGANGRGVVYGAGANEPYGIYNVGVKNSSSGEIQVPGSLAVHTDANGNIRAHFDGLSGSVLFVAWLRGVVDGASGGLAPNVSTYQQQAGDLNPGSGVVRFEAGQHDRWAEVTHYQYGTTIRSGGPDSGGMFEFFLGDQTGHVPNISVRHNGSNLGAAMEVRNAGDTIGLGMRLDNPDEGVIGMWGVTNDTPQRVSVKHPRSDGYIPVEIGGNEQARFIPGGIDMRGQSVEGARQLSLVEGQTPFPVSGQAQIYVDTDGDLKIRFADGTVKTIVAD